MSNRPEMKFKFAGTKIYSPADDLIQPDQIAEMLTHYFHVMDRLKDAEEKNEGLLSDLKYVMDNWISSEVESEPQEEIRQRHKLDEVKK